MNTTEPIIAGDTLLKPGTYVWKLVDSRSNRNIVQISDQRTGHVETTIFAITNYRSEISNKNLLQFWETPKGVPQAVRAWFYPGDNYGQEFAYPKDLIALVARNQLPTATAHPTLEQPLAQPAAKSHTPPPARHSATDRAASQGSWAVATGGVQPSQGVKPAQKATALPKSHSSVWDALGKLPLTATIAPLIGLIGLVSLILYMISSSKRKHLSL